MLHIAALGLNRDDAEILIDGGHQGIASVAQADLGVSRERDRLGIAAQLGAPIGARADDAIAGDDITARDGPPAAIDLLHDGATQSFDGPVGRGSGQNGRKQDQEGKPEFHRDHHAVSYQGETLRQGGCQGLTTPARFRSTAD